MMHTSYPYQTLTLGALPRTQYPFQTLTLGGVGLGATGEAIDAANPPEKGEKLWYERQTQGYIAGAVVGAVGVAAWLLSRSARRAPQSTRALVGAAVPLAAMFAGGYVRTKMVRGSFTPA